MDKPEDGRDRESLKRERRIVYIGVFILCLSFWVAVIRMLCN